MMWVLASKLNPPRFWIRASMDVLSIVGVSWLVYLAAFDTFPPYTATAGEVGQISPGRASPGSLQEVRWDIIEQRRCQEIHIRRALMSAEDPSLIFPLPDAIPVTPESDPIPITRHVISQPFLVPPSMPPGRAFYRVEIISACNWLQAMLPESWWLHRQLPAVAFTVDQKAETAPRG